MENDLQCKYKLYLISTKDVLNLCTGAVLIIIISYILYSNLKAHKNACLMVRSTIVLVIMDGHLVINSLHNFVTSMLNKTAAHIVSFRQRAVIAFLVKEPISAAEYYKRLSLHMATRE